MPITVTDETGAIAGCRSVNVSSGDQGDYLRVLNPQGDLATLAVWMTLDRCTSGADAQFSIATSGYALVITEREAVSGCAGPPVRGGFELDLRTDIAASTVIAIRASPQPTPIPTTTPEGSRQIPCDLVAPIVVDETGLVTDCNGSTTMPAEGAALTVTNATDDQTRLIVSWAEACGSKSSLTFRRSDGGYELEVSWVDRIYICDGLPVQFRVELKVSMPIAAETVTIRYQALSPEPTPSQPVQPSEVRTISASVLVVHSTTDPRIGWTKPVTVASASDSSEAVTAMPSQTSVSAPAARVNRCTCEHRSSSTSARSESERHF
jgi:hypothetical protein